MIFFTLASAALAQWTGPHTEAYVGPGYFCGGGYSVLLSKGDRALVLPQGSGAPSARVILKDRNVSIWTGATRETGRIAQRYGGIVLTEGHDRGKTVYSVSDPTDFALRLTSDSFQGFNRDRWFFSRANFSSAAEKAVRCLSSTSY